MEASGVWKNLLSGKQGVPTVACPSCGAQVPEFRIHSHLDTCLVVVTEPEELPAAAEAVVHEVGARRGRGRGRKRREARETAGRNKRSKHTHVDEVAVDVEEEEDEYARFYERWEYSVTGLDARKETPPLSETQKRELGVLTIERREWISQLDRLLGECQTTDAEDGTPSDHGDAREAWWEQWVAEEWPEGPLPSGFDAGLPPRVGTEKEAANGGLYTTSAINRRESGGINGERSDGVLPHSSESSGREVIEIDMDSPTGEQRMVHPDVERSTDAGRPSSSTAPANHPAETSGASPGLQACPICSCPFAKGAGNREINDHIDQCLTEMACQFD